MYRLFLQQNKCAQIIFATFQAIRKLSRYPKLSRLSGNFLDHPENMQPIRKRFRLSRNFSDHQENIQPIRKISSLSGKHPAYPENIQPIRKLSSLSGNFSGYPETFQAIQKLSRSSGKYPAYPENFQTIRKKSRLSGNFPKGPETSQCNFKGYAQKLSGRAKTFRMAMPPCHPGFWDSGPLVLLLFLSDVKGSHSPIDFFMSPGWRSDHGLAARRPNAQHMQRRENWEEMFPKSNVKTYIICISSPDQFENI